MKISSKELKKRAKQKLMGNYGLCVGAQLIVGAVMSVIFIIVFFAILVSAFLSAGLVPGAGVHMKEFTMILIVVGIVTILMLIIASLLTPGMFKMFLNISGDRPAKISDPSLRIQE